MNENIEKLVKIGQKGERKIIGLMSGTSLDGLDVALCSFKGHGSETEVKLLNFHTIDYSDDERHEIRLVFGKSQIDFQRLCVLNPWIGNLHGEMVLKSLQMWGLSPSDVDVIGSHGQTVFHAPKSFHHLEGYGNSTLQIGDGDHLAVKTGILTISDFRQKHIAMGGEGAPLAIYGDFLLFSQPGEDRIMLNMGGIANFTYLPGRKGKSCPEGIISTDTGPGNTLLDAFSREMFGKSYDKDGDFGKTGKVNENLLLALKTHYFFKQKAPKSTGPELFSTEYVTMALKNTNEKEISTFDLMATLTRFTVETIAETVRDVVKSEENQFQKVIFMSGGGSHNKFLVHQLTDILADFIFHPMDVLGISGDAKEAVLFATLANECLFGKSTYSSGKTTEKSLFNVSMGKISFPT